jgi:glucose-6-phosphate 1-dehydrogenase
VLRSMRSILSEGVPGSLVIGQYGTGIIGGNAVPGYRQEENVSPRSVTPTYAAMKVFIDNGRWQGVPFYLRSGKRLAARTTEIAIHFKRVPHSLFPDSVSGPIEANVIVLKIHPDEGMSLQFQTKQAGTKLCMNPVEMRYVYPRGVLLDAYEWVLLDCILGDHMLFMREDSVELSWSALAQVLARINEEGEKLLQFYPAGTDGPAAAAEMPARDGRTWRPL